MAKKSQREGGEKRCFDPEIWRAGRDAISRENKRKAIVASKKRKRRKAELVKLLEQ